MYALKSTFFDAQVDAPWASTPYGPGENAKLERLFSMLGPLAGRTLLEPGCGTGRLTQVLGEKVGPAGRLIALDISPAMVEVARTRVAGMGHVDLHCAEVETFPLPQGGVDAVVCHQVFPHFTHQKRATLALARSLKVGGTIAITHFIPISEINDVHRKAGTAVAEDRIPPHDEMKRLFMESGLQVDFITDDVDGYFLCGRKV